VTVKLVQKTVLSVEKLPSHSCHIATSGQMCYSNSHRPCTDSAIQKIMPTFAETGLYRQLSLTDNQPTR